jgi:CubicO group peptidase (beta-lactamase class C family)
VTIAALLSLTPPLLGYVAPEGAEARLGAEIEALAERLNIPGIAYGVLQDGQLLFDGAAGHSGSPDQAFTVSTPLDIASISKSIAAVAVMQSIERGELRLSDPVARYLPDFGGPAETTVRHLLSHTSEGIPGEDYKYMPTRYALLGPVLEEATGHDYAAIVRERILEPAGMKEHPSPALTAGWGMISTTEDLFKYAIALDRDRLIERATQERMAAPTESPRGVDLPVSLGWLCQTIQQEPVTWGYGQGDSTSLLFLRVPRLRLTLVIAARSDRLSNPFRLLHGDVRSSPFAMAFFRNLVAARPEGASRSPDWTIQRMAELEAELDAQEAPGTYRFGEELVAHAHLEAFHNNDTVRSGDLLELALRRYPDLTPSLSWLELANAIERESLAAFAVQLADRLVRTRPTSPWVLTVAGDTYMKYGAPSEAVATWSRVAALPNQEKHFVNIGLSAEAWNNIGEYWLDVDPGVARTFFLRAIETGGGWELQRSERLLREAIERFATNP